MSETIDRASTIQIPNAPISVVGAQPEISSDDMGEAVKLVLGEFAGPLDLLL